MARQLAAFRRPRIGLPILLIQTTVVFNWRIDAGPQYNRDVLPILADNCFKCHGLDQAQRKAGLRLDLAEGAEAELESGMRAIVPGNAGGSGLIRRIFAKKTGKQRLARAFALVLFRPPREEESNRLIAHLRRQRTLFGDDAASAGEMCRDLEPGVDPAWVVLCSVLLNLDEFINRE